MIARLTTQATLIRACHAAVLTLDHALFDRVALIAACTYIDVFAVHSSRLRLSDARLELTLQLKQCTTATERMERNALP